MFYAVIIICLMIIWGLYAVPIPPAPKGLACTSPLGTPVHKGRLPLDPAAVSFRHGYEGSAALQGFAGNTKLVLPTRLRLIRWRAEFLQ